MNVISRTRGSLQSKILWQVCVVMIACFAAISGCDSTYIPDDNQNAAPIQRTPGTLESYLQSQTQSGAPDPGQSLDPDDHSEQGSALFLSFQETIDRIERQTNRTALIVDCLGQLGSQRSLSGAVRAATQYHVIVVLPTDVCPGGQLQGEVSVGSEPLYIQSIDPTQLQIVESTRLSNPKGSVLTFINSPTKIRLENAGTPYHPTSANLFEEAIETEDLGSDTQELQKGTRAVVKGLTIEGGIASGIHCSQTSPLIDRCIIQDNTSTTSGGALMCENGSHPIVSNCTIRNNVSTNGGAIACLSGSDPVIFNSLLSRNEAYLVGGAIYGHQSSPFIRNCTITQNVAGMSGGAALLANSNKVYFNNTLIWHNNAPSAPSIGVLDLSTTVSVDYCAIEEGPAGIVLLSDTTTPGDDDPEPGVVWGDSNIEEDPLLDEDGVSIDENSPAQDAGDTTGYEQTDHSNLGRDDRLQNERAEVGAERLRDIMRRLQP